MAFKTIFIPQNRQQKMQPHVEQSHQWAVLMGIVRGTEQPCPCTECSQARNIDHANG